MKRPCLYVPTFELKKAFLEMAYAQGYQYANGLAQSLEIAKGSEELVYATDYALPIFVCLSSAEWYAANASQFVLTNSPRQFFDYLKLRK